MFKFSVFEIYIFILHRVVLAVNPIDAVKFKARFEERKGAEPTSPRDQDSCDLDRLELDQDRDEELYPLVWACLHPIQTINMIKKYQIVGNKELIWCFCYQLILTHLFIKSVIHTFYVGADREMLAYFDSIWYPHIANGYREPAHYNYMFLSFTTLFLFARTRNLIRLVRASVVNADYYKEISVSSLNLAYSASFHLSASEWIEIWNHCWKHRQSINSSDFKYRKHLEFKADIQNKFTKYHKRNLLFSLNMVDFGECYKESVLPEPAKRIERYKAWHFMEPLDRLAPLDLQIVMFLSVIGGSTVILGLASLSIASIYFELCVGFPIDYWPSFMELLHSLPQLLSNPSTVIRILEFNASICMNVPQVYEFFQVVFDVLVITSRANKLTEALDYDSRVCLYQTNCHFDFERRRLRNIERYFPSTYINMRQVDDRIGLNKRISDKASLVELLWMEFLNCKRNHSLTLNVALVGYGTCMSYTVSLFFTPKSMTGYVIIALVLVSCLIPIIIVLVACARSERSLKQLYFAMSELSASATPLLSQSTRELLRAASEPFLKEEGRSFVIFGIYAITLDSVGPFMAYLASAMILMNRFNS